MTDERSILSQPETLAPLREVAERVRLASGEHLFAVGDEADAMYIVESGRVLIEVRKNRGTEVLCELQAGQHFGEMALLTGGPRTAGARVADEAVLLRVARDELSQVLCGHPRVAEALHQVLSARHEELVLTENLVDLTSIQSERLHVSLKGDPSLRETAFSRERYESPVDAILGELGSALKSLLLEHCVIQVFLGFNSGEVRTRSILDPFREEVHNAEQLLDAGYRQRHFPLVSYERKMQTVHGLYRHLAGSVLFTEQPQHWQHILHRSYLEDQLMDSAKVADILDHLVDLRSLPNFYLRNFSINLAQDLIRLQFNCDGAHLLSSVSYRQFLVDNLE